MVFSAKEEICYFWVNGLSRFSSPSMPIGALQESKLRSLQVQNKYKTNQNCKIQQILIMQNKMKKPKKDKGKQQRQQAFMSFLQAPTAASQSVILQTEKKNASDDEDYQEFVEDTNTCYMCSQKLDPIKKKKCGFCNMETCNAHLRKRRRQNKKFQRICDNCENRHLYENYMKLELKAQQALTTQQEIMSLKHEEFQNQAEKIRAKWKESNFKANSIQEKHQKQSKQLQKEQDQILVKEHALEKSMLQSKQIQLFVERASKSIVDNFEEDYKILIIQNQKLGKNLMNLDKRRHEVQKAIQKRQKQIEEAYEAWQRKEYMKSNSRQNKNQQNKKKDCMIY